MDEIVHGLDVPVEVVAGLLPVSRRVFRSITPNTQLQTLERLVLHRLREEDIPGSEIGEAYERFLREGYMYGMERILDHNKQDLITLFALALKIREKT